MKNGTVDVGKIPDSQSFGFCRLGPHADLRSFRIGRIVLRAVKGELLMNFGP